MGRGRVNQRRLRAAKRLEKGWANPIPRARLYQRAPEVEGSYGKVAKKFGVTPEEVCHYVTMLQRLPAVMVMEVDGEHDPRPQRRLSLRALLSIARLTRNPTRKTSALGARRIALVPPAASRHSGQR